MPPISVTIFASDPGTYFLEDDGIPGNNFSRIRFPDGTVVAFEHPTDDLIFDPSVAGITLVIDLIDSLGTARFSTGSFTNPLDTPDAIVVQNIVTTTGITLVANGSITESANSDAAPDIVAASLIMSAGTGVGSAGNALDTQVGVLEAETNTGGINIRNFGTLQIGGLTVDVDGLDVLTSGDLLLTNFGSIVLSDESGPETIHGGTTSGNVTLIANGVDSDVIANIDQDSISAPRGNIVVTAGRDIAFGLIGTNFDNDVRANGTITFTSGRDILLDGFADVVSDAFGQGTGGSVIFNAGRNITLLAVAGTDAGIEAGGSAGADILLTTGPGGTLTLNSGNGSAPFASLISNSGDVVVRADRVSIGTNGAISTPGSGVVTIRPATDGRAINLGSVTDAAFAVELSDAELDRIFTQNLIVGANEAGPVTVSAAISPLNALSLIVRSGTDINVQASVTVGASLSLRAENNVFQLAASTITVPTLTVFVDTVDTDPGVGGIATLNGATTATTVISGNLDDDLLSGASSADTILAFAGNDVLRGFGGNDVLDGGAGFDTMVGGLGNDTFKVDNNNDVVTEAVGQGDDIVVTSVSFALQAGLEVETLGTSNDLGTSTIALSGNEFGQSIFGNAGVNFITGLGGNDNLVGGGGGDTLDGGTGNDVLRGGTGNDTMIVESAGDQVFENVGEGDDVVIANTSYVLAPGVAVETMTTTVGGGINLTGNDFGQSIFGNDDANVLSGDGGGDSLNGAGGNDTLIGGSGNDVLNGGAGLDEFRFNTNLNAATNVDTIVGYSVADDTIALDDLVFNTLPLGTLSANAFVIGSAAADADDRIIYNSATGQLFYDADGNGGGAAVQFATLATGLALTNADFVVI